MSDGPFEPHFLGSQHVLGRGLFQSNCHFFGVSVALLLFWTERSFFNLFLTNPEEEGG